MPVLNLHLVEGLDLKATAVGWDVKFSLYDTLSGRSMSTLSSVLR